MSNIIECRNVSKSFGEKVALDKVSVSIPKGGSRHGYMTLENGVFRWMALTENGEGECLRQWP